MKTPKIKNRRKICVVTGSRAEYGLLYWVLKEIQKDRDLQLQLVATGMHCAPEFGMTAQAIETDGFSIDWKVEMQLSSDSTVGVTKSLGLGVLGFADALSHLKPDLILILGDRYEIFAAAQAAMVARIPIAHIHGGESTEGLIDEAIRHAITKMAHFHFVTADVFRTRVIQMGEDPKYVYNVGAPGLDHVKRMDFMDRSSLEKDLSFKFGSPNFLVTYHPVTLEQGGASSAMTELLGALDEFPESKILFTKSNSDTDGRLISKFIDSYVQKNSNRAKAFVSLGQKRYLSTLKTVDVVIGNSSSGIIEAPAFKIPTVNVGDRQRGRPRASSIIDCQEQKAAITKGIKTALSTEFKKSMARVLSPYGSGNASERIISILKQADLKNVLKKKFHDLPVKI